MNKKKLLSLLLITTVFAASVSGCSSTNKTNKASSVPMGRYIEKVITMPEAVQSKEEYAIIMHKNPKGQLTIYTSREKAPNKNAKIQYILQKDHTWKKSIPEWLNKKGMSLQDVTYASDGTMYASVTFNRKNSVKVEILKSTDGIHSEEVVLDKYKKNVGYDKMPYNLQILEDNSLLLTGSNWGTVYQNGKEKISFEIGDYKYAISGKKLITMNENMDQIILVDLNNGKILSSMATENSGRHQFAADTAGNWYLINDIGVQRMVKDGNTWETILNGSQAEMSKPSLGVDSIVFGDKDNFYIMYQGENGLRSIDQYTYDKDKPSVAANTLSVVTLNESFTIKQSISDFNRAHQDTQILYKVLINGTDNTTVTDQIKTLNTEILSGKGPDLIVLDGLPIDSYIQKNVLADISSIIKPMQDKGELLNNVMNHCKTPDDKIYAAPLRVTIPLAFGSKEAVKSTASINSLAEYAGKANLPVFGSEQLSYKDLTTILFKLYSVSFLSDKGFDRTGLINFLKQLKIISDQTQTKAEELQNSILYEADSSTSCRLIYDKAALLGIQDINHMYCVYQPIVISDKTQGSYQTINKEYTPREMIGLNSSCTDKELASEFIQNLLSENVQISAMGDGFPVNINALNNFGMAPDDVVLGWDNFDITQPSKEKMQGIVDLFKAADTPVIINQELLDMVITDAKGYLSGKEQLESTADKIIARTKTYLSE